VGLIDRINKVSFYPAFNIISDSLHQSVILSLCRIWDKPADTANLNGLAREFRDAKVIAGLAAVGHIIDQAKLRKWLSEINAVNNSAELSALKRARHRAIAHTPTPNKPYQGKSRGSRYGDERKIMERTMPLVEQAGAFIGYSYGTPYVDQRRIRREHAEKFWANVTTTAWG
jgi:HEPN superfamily AbiU2-like protein